MWSGKLVASRSLLSEIIDTKSLVYPIIILSQVLSFRKY